MSAPSPLGYFDILADRQLRPAALMPRLDSGAGEGIPALVTAPGFAGLAAALPCLLDDWRAGSLPPDTRRALEEAGCRIVPRQQIHRSDSLPPVFPEEALWLTGDWHLLPPARPAAAHAASHATALRLLELVAADADNRAIEEVFRQDPSLAYHLLRLVNSAGIGTGRAISSFAQALLILGRQQLRRWLNLLLFTVRKGDARAPMLLAGATARARGLELLARAIGMDALARDHAFLVGMFSRLDALFGISLAEILKPLALARPLAEALLERSGPLGTLLRTVEAAERGDFVVLAEHLRGQGLSVADFDEAVIEAHLWMAAVVRDLPGDGDD